MKTELDRMDELCTGSGPDQTGPDDAGFTLIELMVVLLIIAILLAIAIPTFLGARNTANARSTQENLRNALTAESTNFATNQTFTTGLTTIESDINWTTTSIGTAGGNTVGVQPYSWNSGSPTATSGTADSVEIYGYAQDGNCYAIFRSNNSTTSFTAYSEYAPSGSSLKSCATNAAPSSPPAAGTTASTASSGTWSASF